METAAMAPRGRAIDGLPERLANADDLETKLQIIGDAVVRVVECGGLAIYVAADLGSGSPAQLVPLTLAGEASSHALAEDALVRRVAASWLREPPAAGTRISFGSVTILPIPYCGECVGALVIEHGDQSFPTDNRARDLGNLVGLAALAIANHRLRDEGRRLSSELRALQGIGRAVSSSPSISATLDGLFATSADVIDFDTASLFVIDETEGVLKLAASRNLPAETAARCRFKVGEGVVGWVVAQDQPAIVPDTLRDIRFKLSGARRRQKGHSLLVVPLRLQGQVVAALSFARHRPDGFSKRDLELAEVVAAYAAQALEHARLVKTAAEVETLRQGAELLAGVSHDIRAPLSLIRVVVGLLHHQFPDADPKQLELLETIAKASNQLGNLVNAVLETSRLDTSLLDLRSEPVRVCELAESAFATLSWRASERHRLVSEVPTCLAVAGDPTQLQRVVTNLVDNAIKYSPDGGPIAIRARAEGATVAIEVSDQGIGIPADKQSQVFERFRRGSEEAAAKESFGLGLYVCKRIVEAHRGSIELRSAPGKGSAFTVRLPAAVAETPALNVNPGARLPV